MYSNYNIDIKALVQQEMKRKLTQLCINADKVQDCDFIVNELWDCLEAFEDVNEKVKYL